MARKRKTFAQIVAAAQAKKHRSPMPPPSQIHADKRRSTRAQERVNVRRMIERGDW